MDINDNTPTLKDMYITFNNFVQKSTSSRPALMEDVAGDETEFPINQVIGKLNFYDPDVMDIFEFGQEGQEDLPGPAPKRFHESRRAVRSRV